MSSSPFRRTNSTAPSLYFDFLEEAKEHVAKCGLRWDMRPDDAGQVPLERRWDIRRLVKTREENGAYLASFAIDDELRKKAVEAGWGTALLASGNLLDTNTQDFIKAVVVHFAKREAPARVVRDLARHCRSFFSVLACSPWEVSSDDFARFLSLAPVEGGKKAAMQLKRLVNQRLLSLNGPITAKYKSLNEAEILEQLSARAGAGKLPEERAMYELARIVFQEAPRSHVDLLRFGIVRIIYLSGLRVGEARWLPVDCLVWMDHIDPTTGKPAGDVGGVSKTLRLRYFVLKREEGSPATLVEEYQPVPDIFQQHVAQAVEWMKEATAELRLVLLRQSLEPERYPNSHSARFRTVAGGEVCNADLLFLTIHGHREQLPSTIPLDARIGLVSRQTVYDFLGGNTVKHASCAFEKYRRPDSPPSGAVKPHALRHLLDTELFRGNAPDTFITMFFGRSGVKQSYEYDHRSLAEKLSFIKLPQAASETIPQGSLAESVAKMVVSGLVPASHVSITFLAVQKEHGDETAFAYLAANADGFHVTPYGFCVNSFALNPCTRKLNCFNNCNQFTPSGLQEHRVNLTRLRDRIQVQLDKAMTLPATAVARSNQILSAEASLKGIAAALAGTPGVRVFPDGVDHSVQHRDLFS